MKGQKSSFSTFQSIMRQKFFKYSGQKLQKCPICEFKLNYEAFSEVFIQTKWLESNTVGKNCKNVPYRNLNLEMRLLMRVLYRVIWRQQRHSWVTEKISLKSFQLWPLQFLKSISWVNKILLKFWPLFEWLFGKWVSWRDKEELKNGKIV